MWHLIAFVKMFDGVSTVFLGGDMELGIEDRGKVTIVRVEESHLDHHNKKEFIEKLSGAIKGGRHNLVVDLQGVVLFTSGGFEAIIGALKTAHQHNGTVKLCGLLPQHKLLAEMAKWDRMFEIFPSAEEAIASFG